MRQRSRRATYHSCGGVNGPAPLAHVKIRYGLVLSCVTRACVRFNTIRDFRRGPNFANGAAAPGLTIDRCRDMPRAETWSISGLLKKT